MIILSRKPVTLAEVKSHLKNTEEKSTIEDYLKAFTKLSADKAVACAEEIRELNNPKISEEMVVKLIDFIPEDTEDLNKIFNTAMLTEEESNALLNILRKY